MPQSGMGYVRLLFSIGLGIGLAISVVSGVAAAPAEVALTSVQVERLSEVISPSVLSLTYARVVTGEVLVYAHPSHANGGGEPVRSLGTGYLWISLEDTRLYAWEGELWYLINENEYVRADQLEVYDPSTFRGVALSGQPRYPFAWIIYDTWASPAPDAIPPAGTPLLPRYTRVTIYETRQGEEWDWYRIGKDQWIEQRTAGVVKPSPRPEGVLPSDKWIEVDLFQQTLAAYEGDRMVYATLVSSGLPWWQTEQGLFRVWTKVKQAKMSGRDGYPDYYFLEDVPWTMYFNRSFSLHAAYWHDRFGYPHSHGCVNLPARDAKWLFDWATPETGPYNWTVADEDNVGTWVWVHDGEEADDETEGQAVSRR